MHNFLKSIVRYQKCTISTNFYQTSYIVPFVNLIQGNPVDFIKQYLSQLKEISLSTTYNSLDKTYQLNIK